MKKYWAVNRTDTYKILIDKPDENKWALIAGPFDSFEKAKSTAKSWIINEYEYQLAELHKIESGEREK